MKQLKANEIDELASEYAVFCNYNTSPRTLKEFIFNRKNIPRSEYLEIEDKFIQSVGKCLFKKYVNDKKKPIKNKINKKESAWMIRCPVEWLDE